MILVITPVEIILEKTEKTQLAEKLKENAGLCLVDKTKFRDFFGPIFADRAFFSASKTNQKKKFFSF